MISAFDLAPGLCGVCAGSGAEMPSLEVWRLPAAAEDLGLMLEDFDRQLSAHLDRARPETVAYEGPILVPRRDKILTLRRIFALGAHLEFVCRTRGIECGEIDLHEIKLEMTGDRNGDKDRIVEVCERAGIPLPTGPGRKDAADAFGAWVVSLRLTHSDAYRQWASRIWTKRGALI